METRIAVIGIIVENKDSVESVNELLHQYSQYIIGRMGLPYPKEKGEHHKRCGGCAPGHHKRPVRQTGQASGH